MGEIERRLIKRRLLCTMWFDRERENREPLLSDMKRLPAGLSVRESIDGGREGGREGGRKGGREGGEGGMEGGREGGRREGRTDLDRVPHG